MTRAMEPRRTSPGMAPGLANILVLEPGLGPKERVYLDGQEAEAWADLAHASTLGPFTTH